MTMLEEWMEEATIELKYNESSIARHSDLDFKKYKLKKILALCALVKAYREAVKERETGIDLALAMLRNFNSDASKKIIDEVLDKALAHQVDEERILK